MMDKDCKHEFFHKIIKLYTGDVKTDQGSLIHTPTKYRDKLVIYCKNCGMKTNED